MFISPYIIILISLMVAGAAFVLGFLSGRAAQDCPQADLEQIGADPAAPSPGPYAPPFRRPHCPQCGTTLDIRA